MPIHCAVYRMPGSSTADDGCRRHRRRRRTRRRRRHRRRTHRHLCCVYTHTTVACVSDGAQHTLWVRPRTEHVRQSTRAAARRGWWCAPMRSQARQVPRGLLGGAQGQGQGWQRVFTATAAVTAAAATAAYDVGQESPGRQTDRHRHGMNTKPSHHTSACANKAGHAHKAASAWATLRRRRRTALMRCGGAAQRRPCHCRATGTTHTRARATTPRGRVAAYRP